MIERGIFDTLHVKINLHQSDDVLEVKQWCRNNIALSGPESWHCRIHAWTYERFDDHTNFVFDREQDAILFALRWS